ncbi:YciI family protein [uncultured Sphingomonas sp.]|uniref:YciI family protein n=1 Tax=uncultured Sphingomonas sp. TaxID=158754 RepID=UPI0035CA0B71
MSEKYFLPGIDFCVVLLGYDGAQDAIDAAMAEHLAWMNACYEEGTILLSGRRTPWTGGVMLVRGDKTRADALLSNMPFVVKGLATTEVIGFTTGMAAPAIRDSVG